MAPIPYLRKKLSSTDTNHRLSWPTKSHSTLFALGRGTSRHVHFRVRGNDGSSWRFCCSTRKMGYLKPVVTGEWLRFVKHKGLKPGDQVIFYENGDDSKVPFTIAVKRLGSIKLLGVEVQGYMNEE